MVTTCPSLTLLLCGMTWTEATCATAIRKTAVIYPLVGLETLFLDRNIPDQHLDIESHKTKVNNKKASARLMLMTIVTSCSLMITTTFPPTSKNQSRGHNNSCTVPVTVQFGRLITRQEFSKVQLWSSFHFIFHYP